MSSKSPPFEINGIEEKPNQLVLTYLNEAGNSAIKRTYTKSNEGSIVHETDEEWMLSCVDQEWERVHQFTHEYELANDEQTLVGDGSGWSGDGENWKEWFKAWHRKRLGLRYPYDSIQEETPKPQQKAIA